VFIGTITGKDITEILRMLNLEGEHGGGYITPANTFIFNDDEGLIGFLTVKIEKNVPVLLHFVVKRERRSLKTTREMIKETKKFIKNMGFAMFIVPVKKDYLKRFVEYFAKRKPYAVKDGISFYLVGV